MLQQFYKDTLQSNFIKYLLANTYIPTVPFTANIMHVTKGNIYIHDGYFVTAKKSDAVAAIVEDLEKANNEGQAEYLKKYSEIFIKHEPYIFGRQYFGTTTNYLSNVKGYDPTTHYYLGEFLRAYKAYYNIDLMPYYNCFSNEYIDYLSLAKKDGTVTLVESSNSKYKLLSVPIKFCQKYSIAIQCNSEVQMLPVFIGKKGLLEEKTSELHQLGHQGKSYSRLQFNSPIIYESPHINSVQDLVQASLQNYDKYLRLLIQVPANLTSSIVVIEGEYKNAENYSERIINTSKKDVLELWAENYSTKIPYSYDIDVPANSTLVCNNIELQKIYLDYNNSPLLYNNESLFTISINDSTNALKNYVLDNACIKTQIYPTVSDYVGPPQSEDSETIEIPEKHEPLSSLQSQLQLEGSYVVNYAQDGELISFDIDCIEDLYIEFPFTSNGISFKAVKYIYDEDTKKFSIYYIPTDYTEEEDNKTLVVGDSKLIAEDYICINIEKLYAVDSTTKDNFDKIFISPESLLTTSLADTADEIKNQQAVNIELDWIRVPNGTFGSNYAATKSKDENDNYIITNYYQYESDSKFYISESSKGKYDEGSEVSFITDYSFLQIPIAKKDKKWSQEVAWSDLTSENSNYKVIISTKDKEGKSIRSIIARKENEVIKFYQYELSFYCPSENINSTSNKWVDIKINNDYTYSGTLNIKNNQLILEFNNKCTLPYYIKSNPYYKSDSTYIYDLWELNSKIYKKENQFTKYLNKNLYSNLNLLYINNNFSYAFTSRLIEYLTKMVICSNDPISKNIKRVQESVNTTNINGIWRDELRVEIFNKVKEKSIKLDREIPRDINGFLDKDSESLIGIQNKIKQDEIWK